MHRKIYYMILTVFFMLNVDLPARAEMTSLNYRIYSSVYASGGASSGSATYRINGTLGQPTPILKPSEWPFSDNYDSLPGFWFTVQNAGLSKRLKSIPWIPLLLLDD